jgi:antibiotic biosynthesis monooxygenase (ABM) superfamily enzyme
MMNLKDNYRRFQAAKAVYLTAAGWNPQSDAEYWCTSPDRRQLFMFEAAVVEQQHRDKYAEVMRGIRGYERKGRR